jgi:ADP-ribosylglycohydrolase
MLLEMAIADAYGAGFEYAPRPFVAEKNSLRDYVAHPKHALVRGAYTDDTQMALAIAELLVERGDWTRTAIAQKFVEAFKRDPRPGYSQSFYWFLREVRDGEEFCRRIRPNSEKSGAAMRAPPLGLLGSIEEIKEKAAFQAQLTHATEGGIASAQAAALLAHFCAYDLGPPRAAGLFLEKHVGGPWAKPWHGRVGPFGVDAVHAACYVVSRRSSLAEILKEAVSLTGDVDTVAAIAVAAASTSADFAKDLPQVLVDNLERGEYGYDYLRVMDATLWRSIRNTNR